MKAVKINKELDKYIDVTTEHDRRASELLNQVGLPKQYYEALNIKHEIAEICQLLKTERKKHHLSQTELAQKLLMQKEFISRIENGHVDIQLSTLLKIVDGLGLKLNIGRSAV